MLDLEPIKADVERARNRAVVDSLIYTVMPTLIEEVELLRALVEDAFDRDHAAGCSGGHGEEYDCKCELRDWLPRARKALGME